MIDPKKWNLAVARFDAFRLNIPTHFNEETVLHYHGILDDLAAASGEDLSTFKISADKLRHKVASVRRSSTRHGSVTYTQDRYCDSDHFKAQVQGLTRYLEAIQSVDREPAGNDYWRMSDSQLERLANDYHIAPWGRAGEHGEKWFINRKYIIDELVKRDRVLEPAAQRTSNTINVGQMTGSVIQQGSPEANAIVNFTHNDPKVVQLIEKIKAAEHLMNLSGATQSQFQTDLETIRVQITSEHPKTSIITESLRSIRSVLEDAAGSLVASGVIYEISKLIGN